MAILLLLSLIGVSAPAQESATGFYEDALLRFQSDDYKGAIVELKNALQADPENLPARILLGRANLRLGAAAAAEVFPAATMENVPTATGRSRFASTLY